VTGTQLQGGSTITQQMVRNYYGGIGTERSIDRKLKEIMVALKVGREKDKDWILEQYLNTIYFGRDAYGVQAAAKAYYGKDVSKLTAREGAYLAAAIQQPSRFADPTGPNRAPAEQRWRGVVANMVKDGSVGAAEASAMTFPAPDKQKITDIFKGQKGYMVNVAKKELIERRGYSEDEINRSGLKITTTFDKRLMDAAREAVVSNAPDGMSKKIRTGLVSVDPATGQVLAFYGGRDYLTEALSSSFGDWAQAGSGFKPVVLAAALDDGMKLYDSVDGSSPQYYNGTPVKNDEGHSYGYVNLVGATQNSVNTAYVNIGRKVGLDKVTEMAEKMGIPESQLTANGANTAPTFPLGVISMHPVQQAGVYATFASEGQHRTPFVVKSVTNNDDHKRSFTEPAKRAFSQQVARDATYAMERVVRSGTGTAAQLPDGRDVAGKTGTTDEGRAIWFNGFIPQMATSVSMFRSDSKPLSIPGYGVYGGVLPARIWNSYMSDAVSIKGYSPESFGSPSVNTGGDYVGQRPDRPGDGRPEEPGPSRPPGSEEPEEPSEPPIDEGPELPELPPPPGDEPPGEDPGDPGDGDNTGNPRPGIR
jgi:membrane peptidoglycan carboxypeptidase